MRRPISILALALATAITATACGGGSPATTSAGAAGAAPAAAAPAAAASAAPADSAAAMDDNAAAGGAAPQITAMRAGDSDETTGEKLPQGASEAKAKAAGMGTDGAPVISVTATDTGCLPDKSTVAAGKVWFKITNKGAKINELYLESTKGVEMIEVEKIRKGTAGAFSKKVTKGNYLLACSPGMTDSQIRTPLTVTDGM